MLSRYSFNGINIRLLCEGENTLLEGEVLIPSLLNKLRIRLKASGLLTNVRLNIHISAIDRRISRNSFFIPAENKINLYSSPQKNKLSIQVLRGDPPLCRIAEMDSLSCLWTPFRCYGWTDTKNLVSTEINQKYTMLTRGQCIVLTRKELLSFKEILFKEYLEKGIGYSLGASSRDEVDCSGFIMRTVYDRFKVCMPKHSEDQFNISGYATNDPKELDIIYARSILKGNKHIAFLFLQGNSIRVLEASYRKKKVIACDLENFKQRFNIVGIRRLFWVL